MYQNFSDTLNTFLRICALRIHICRVWADMRAIACARGCVCAGKYIRFIGGRGQIEPYVFRYDATIPKASFCVARAFCCCAFHYRLLLVLHRDFFLSSFLRTRIYPTVCPFPTPPTPFDSGVCCVYKYIYMCAHTLRGQYVFVEINVQPFIHRGM